MSEPASASPARVPAIRGELRLIAVGGAVLFIALFVFYALTLQPPLAPLRLALFGLVSLLMAGMFALSVPRSERLLARRDAGKAGALPFVLLTFLGSLVWPFTLALLLHGRAPLYFYLATADGYGTLRLVRRRGWALLLLGCLIAVDGLSYVAQSGWTPAGPALLRDLPWFAFMVAITELFVRQWEQRERTEALTAELAKAYEQLRGHVAQAEALAVSQERNRIAHEVHDTVGHTLAALGLQVELLARLPADDAAARARTAREVRKLVRAGQAEVWRAVQALRPAALEALSLPEALHKLAEDFAHTGGAEVAWQEQGVRRPLPPRCVLPLYRAMQEALTNVQRHAPRTGGVTASLCYTPEGVALTVENSAAIDSDRKASETPAEHPRRNARAEAPAGRHPHGGHGLRGLRERAAEAGGNFEAGPTPEGGFRLHIFIPGPD